MSKSDFFGMKNVTFLDDPLEDRKASLPAHLVTVCVPALTILSLTLQQQANR